MTKFAQALSIGQGIACGIAGITHRPEFYQLKDASVLSGPCLAEKHGSAQFASNQEGRAQQDKADAQKDAAKKEAEAESARGSAKAAEKREESHQ